MVSAISKPLFELDTIDFAYVYGSYAKGRQKEHSDLDIAVYINNPVADITSFVMNLKLVLEDVIRREVHLAVLNSAPPLLKQQVLKNGVLVFERDRRVRIEFIKRSYFEFFQYQNILNKIMEINKKKIREKISHD